MWEKKRLNDKCVLPRVEHGGGSVMVWERAGDLIYVKGIIKKEIIWFGGETGYIQFGLHRIWGRESPFNKTIQNILLNWVKIILNLKQKQKQKKIFWKLWWWWWWYQSSDLTSIELSYDKLSWGVWREKPKKWECTFPMHEECMVMSAIYSLVIFFNSFLIFWKMLERMPRI